MSVVSSNPFAALDGESKLECLRFPFPPLSTSHESVFLASITDLNYRVEDGDSSPAPAPAKTAQTAAANKQPAASNTPRNVPGSTPRGTGQRGGRYPSRGGPRNVSRDDNGPRNTGPDPASGTMEGFEGAGGFEGERVGVSSFLLTTKQG